MKCPNGERSFACAKGGWSVGDMTQYRRSKWQVKCTLDYRPGPDNLDSYTVEFFLRTDIFVSTSGFTEIMFNY